MNTHDLCDNVIVILLFHMKLSRMIVCDVVGEKSKKTAKKSRKFVPAPLLVEVQPNPGPGHGSNWNEERRWRTILKWKDEKK